MLTFICLALTTLICTEAYELSTLGPKHMKEKARVLTSTKAKRVTSTEAEVITTRQTEKPPSTEAAQQKNAGTEGFPTTASTEQNTHCLDHIGIPSLLPNKSQEALMRYSIVPDYITDIPEHGVEVKFPSGAKADFGNIVPLDQIKERPSVKWPAEDSEYYAFFMIDPDIHRKVLPESSLQYVYWLVGNIPGNNIEKGQTLVDYRLLKTSEEYIPVKKLIDRLNQKINRFSSVRKLRKIGNEIPTIKIINPGFHRLIFVVHYQMEGPKNFSEPLLKKYRNNLFIHNFTRKYLLHGPLAANFIRLHVPMNDSLS